VRSIQPARKAPVLHFPLLRLALCLDCDSCFELGPGTCPACGSETLAPLARFFQPNGNSGGNGKLRKQLLVVARENPHIYEYLKRMFAGNETLEVVLDRRGGDRRGQGMAKLPDRRRSNDRRHQEIDSQLRALGWAIVLLDVAREQDRERGGRPRHVR
jgi:hypothetical protein